MGILLDQRTTELRLAEDHEKETATISNERAGVQHRLSSIRRERANYRPVCLVYEGIVSILEKSGCQPRWTVRWVAARVICLGDVGHPDRCRCVNHLHRHRIECDVGVAVAPERCSAVMRDSAVGVLLVVSNRQAVEEACVLGLVNHVHLRTVWQGLARPTIGDTPVADECLAIAEHRRCAAVAGCVSGGAGDAGRRHSDRASQRGRAVVQLERRGPEGDAYGSGAGGPACNGRTCAVLHGHIGATADRPVERDLRHVLVALDHERRVATRHIERSRDGHDRLHRRLLRRRLLRGRRRFGTRTSTAAGDEDGEQGERERALQGTTTNDLGHELLLVSFRTLVGFRPIC